MIQVTILVTRVNTESGRIAEVRRRMVAYLAPERIDTATEMTDHATELIPPEVRSVIRYDCRTYGYRLFYCLEGAKEVAQARRREMRGDDSSAPDFSGA